MYEIRLIKNQDQDNYIMNGFLTIVRFLSRGL